MGFCLLGGTSTAWVLFTDQEVIAVVRVTLKGAQRYGCYLLCILPWIQWRSHAMVSFLIVAAT